MKYFIFVLLLGIMFTTAPSVSADVAFPECKWNEITASCNCPHAYDVCADNTCSACLEYKNDPRYYFLWKDIYCRKASALELVAKYEYSFLIPLLTMLLLESAVFMLRGFRKTKEVLSVVFVNSISFFVAIFLLGPIPKLTYGIFSFLNIPNIPFTLYGMDAPRIVSLLMIATVITVLEALALIYIAKFGDRKKVFTAAIMANFASMILGMGILNAIYPHFLQPRLF